MSIFKKLFGKKKDSIEELTNATEDNDLDMEVSFGSELDLKEEDYNKHLQNQARLFDDQIKKRYLNIF